MPTTSFQKSVENFVSTNNLEIPAPDRLLDLVSEVGELAKEILKGSAYGGQPISLGENWSGELGDVFFSLICLANSTGVDLFAALEGALEKYRNRITDRGDAGSGDNLRFSNL